MNRYYKSDFHFRLVPGDGQRMPEGVNWAVRVYTKQAPGRVYRAYMVDGAGTNCFLDDGRPHVVCDSHGLQPGEVMAELLVNTPNALYADGRELTGGVYETGVVLTADRGDEPGDIDVEVVMPYVYTSAYEIARREGFEGTAEEYAAALAEVGDMAEALNTSSGAIAENSSLLAQVSGTVNLLSDVVDTKQKIAEALTSQGVPMTADASSDEMADAVRQLYLPNESDFWKAFGYASEEDFDGLNATILADMTALRDAWPAYARGEKSTLVGNWGNEAANGKTSILIIPKVATDAVDAKQLFYGWSQLRTVPQLTLRGSMEETFYGCSSLRVLPPLDTTRVTGVSGCFSYCNALSHIMGLDFGGLTFEPGAYVFMSDSQLFLCRITNLKHSLSFATSPNLSAESVAYIVSHSANTSAITITLHADAYARAIADAEVQAALEAHPLVTLASA